MNIAQDLNEKFAKQVSQTTHTLTPLITEALDKEIKRLMLENSKDFESLNEGQQNSIANFIFIEYINIVVGSLIDNNILAVKPKVDEPNATAQLIRPD